MFRSSTEDPNNLLALSRDPQNNKEKESSLVLPLYSESKDYNFLFLFAIICQMAKANKVSIPGIYLHLVNNASKSLR